MQQEEALVTGEGELNLPALVDNSAKFKGVEEQTSTDLTSETEPVIMTIHHPKVGDFIFFTGQRFVVTKELRRHRFVMKWHG